MKNLFLTILTFLSLTLSAQVNLTPGGNKPARLPANIQIDKSTLECIYSHKTFDPKKDMTIEKYHLLQIGNNYSAYSNYGAFRVDSVIKEIYPNGLTRNDYSRLFKQYQPSFECVVKDLHNNSITTYDKVFMDRYYYTEPSPNIKWHLEKGTREICGYNCKKATANFRGRNWTAWYCDIPLNNGPWKFGNLPGLILRVEDSKGEHVFEAISLRKSKRDFGYKKFDYFKTTREKYNEALAEYKNNPGVMVAGMVQNPDGTPKTDFKPMFFNPIELE